LKGDRDESVNGWKSYNERREYTRGISEYITEQGYNLVEMWGCEWKRLKKTVKFVTNNLYPGEEKVYLREGEIMKMIKDGSLFGAVEVDIRVPEHLKKYFEEMTPLFKNTTVSYEDIGEYMQAHLKTTNKSFKEERYLIGSMFADKILLITPLLRWYLEHGLEVTKIHQLIQFNPKPCFKTFGDRVSDDRRAGEFKSFFFFDHCFVFCRLALD